MSHLIIPNIDRVFTPKGDEIFAKTWHNLQTEVEGGIATDGSNVADCFAPIFECGIKADFDAEISNVPEELQAEMGLEKYKMILADTRGLFGNCVLPLHVPKAGYKIHQNRELFDAMVGAAIQVLGADGFKIVTVGTLGGYSQFFLSIAIKGHESFNVGELANGSIDAWKRFFNLNSSHNGLIASNRLLSLIRMVCFNTVQSSISDATESGTISAIKHTVNSGELISAHTFARDLKIWLENGEKFQALLEYTKSEKMDLAGFQSFAAGVFTNKASDELSTNSFNRIGELSALFARGQGNMGATRYDAINAFTEFFTSGNGNGNPKNVGANKRAANANFGRGNDWKLAAIETATNPEFFTEASKRGEILYADKLTAIAAGN